MGCSPCFFSLVVLDLLCTPTHSPDPSCYQESFARDEVVRLQTALRGKEERLANTVVSYLVRHESSCRGDNEEGGNGPRSMIGRRREEKKTNKNKLGLLCTAAESHTQGDAEQRAPERGRFSKSNG